MNICKSLIAFYRNVFVEKIGVLVRPEEGLLARSEALQHIRNMTKQLKAGLDIGEEPIYLEDVFDSVFSWWFIEHHENMLRQCPPDCLTLAYDDLMHEMVFFNDEAVGEDAISAPRVRNDLRQIIQHALKMMMDKNTSPRDIKATRRRLTSKIVRASTLDKIGYHIDRRDITGMFEEALMRDAKMLNRYTVYQQYGRNPNSLDGFEQLQQMFEECDLPDVQINFALLHPRADHNKRDARTEKVDNVELMKAQKALIDILDGISRHSLRYDQAARVTKSLSQDMQEIDDMLYSRYRRYRDAMGKDDESFQNMFTFSLLNQAVSDHERNS